jgi:hypothetical protein
MDNTNEINNNAEKLLMAVRQTVMVTNLSLAGALETSFQAMYEKKEGILFMGIRADSTAVLIATGEGSNSIIQLNVVLGKDCFGERKSIYKLETHEETIQVWQKLRDKVYEWSDELIDEVELD